VKFAGFPDRALVFYEGLEADNSKPYWTDNKKVYEEEVRAPMEALLAELAPEFGEPKIFRPYRDVRFSKDKTPYKTAIGGYIRNEEGAGSYYVQLSADGLHVAGGMWGPAPDQIARMRRAIDEDVSGKDLERIVTALRRGGYNVNGNPTTRMPRGFDTDHPRADLLKHRQLTAGRAYEPEPWLHERAALTKVRTAWRAVATLNTWLATHVGASAETASRR
jgi:uncharacterized protein (TIGR02453 family)